MLLNMKVYVMHYKKLIERKEHIINELGKHNINFEFYEKYDKEELTQEDLKLFSKSMRDSEKSLLLKHLNTYKDIIEKNIPYALIFEDDVILVDDFNNILNKYMFQLPEDWDILFIGNGCNLHIPNNKLVENQFIYEKSHNGGCTRCTDSYLITQNCAKKIVDLIEQNKDILIKKPADWWLNEVLRTIDAKVYWTEPTIVSQGTENNIFKSSIR